MASRWAFPFASASFFAFSLRNALSRSFVKFLNASSFNACFAKRVRANARVPLLHLFFCIDHFHCAIVASYCDSIIPVGVDRELRRPRRPGPVGERQLHTALQLRMVCKLIGAHLCQALLFLRFAFHYGQQLFELVGVAVN